MRYADVVIVDKASSSIDKSFTYGIPEEIDSEIMPGTPVMIPFGSGNRLRRGYVVGIKSRKPDVDFPIKFIESRVDRGLDIEDELMAVAYHMKSFYGGMIKDSLNTVIPVKTSVSKRGATAKEAFPELAELRKLYPEGDGKRIVLNGEQQQACDKIQRDMEQGIFKTYLLFGITGSGKTEVYIEAIRNCIRMGKQAIVLIPEISLTYQTVKRFALAFGNSVAFSHSKLSKGERYIQSQKARNGEISIMIGPRSALFTPFKKLGLIIVDEEHEASYKSETTPKYHAVEVAKWRADLCGASVILGSATPSVDSYRKAENGEYELLKLNNRAGNAKLPKAYIVDLRQELKNGNRTVFSNLLWEKINDRLEKRQQIMLFINRRGYSGMITCRSCGHVSKCPHCDISLTLHNDGGLYCHYCGYKELKTKNCPICGSPFYGGFGTGTQKIEEAVRKSFPNARVLRMDADTTSKKGDFEKILSKFHNREADILIGTQMIVKGHDFPNVTLVGILAADLSLYANDYRAAERTYQLISQCAGRAGRGGLDGEVVIQTYNPQHYCIQTAADNDYEGFYNQEIMYRRIGKYPPAGNMCVIFIQSSSEDVNEQICQKLTYSISEYEKRMEQKFKVTGPVPASIKKVSDVYRHVIYVKDEDYLKLVGLKDGLEFFIKKQNIKDAIVSFDFNPMNGY